MRALFVIALLAGGAAYAQQSCQSKCLEKDTCSSCTDDRCMRRCSEHTQSCMQACEKNDPNGGAKPVKLTGTCPGPGGRKIPCDQISQKAPSEEELKNMMAHPKTKERNKEKDEANVPHVMPTADNYQQLYNDYQKKKHQ